VTVSIIPVVSWQKLRNCSSLSPEVKVNVKARQTANGWGFPD
jgi:hypothetical protein